MSRPGSPRRRGFSLIELMVTLTIMSVVMIGAFRIFQEGMQLFRTNQAAADAQAAAIKVLSLVTTEVVNATPEVAKYYDTGSGEPPGIVFATPLMDGGGSRFDPITGELYWQRYVSFYFEPNPDPNSGDGKIWRAQQQVAPENVGGPGHRDVKNVIAPFVDANPTSYFQTAGGIQRRLVASNISGFNVELYTGDVGGGTAAEKVAFNITVEAGQNPAVRLQSGYYIKVKSKVTPRG